MCGGKSGKQNGIIGTAADDVLLEDAVRGDFEAVDNRCGEATESQKEMSGFAAFERLTSPARHS
jgi:hypothetical protein